MKERFLGFMAIYLLGGGIAVLLLSLALPKTVLHLAGLISSTLCVLAGGFWFGYMAASNTSIPALLPRPHWITRDASPALHYGCYGLLIGGCLAIVLTLAVKMLRSLIV